MKLNGESNQSKRLTQRKNFFSATFFRRPIFFKIAKDMERVKIWKKWKDFTNEA